MKIIDFNIKRESLDLPVDGKIEVWDYLTIYDKNGEVIVRSIRHHSESSIYLNYNELTFYAPSWAKNEDDIFISVQSIKNYV